MEHLLRLVALRRLVGSPLRTAITIVGIALGVASVVSMSLVNDGVLRSVRKGIEAIAGRADLEVSAGSVGLAESALELVRAVPGVAHAAPILEVTATVTAPPAAAGESLLIVGLDTLGDPYFTEDPLEGGKTVDIEDPIAFLNAPDSLLLSGRMARRIGVRVGGKVEVVTATGVRPLTVRGLLPEGGLGRAFGGDVGVMDVFAMQIAFGRQGRFDRIQIALRRGTSLPKARRRIARALGSGVDVEAPRARAGRQEKMLFGMQAGTMIAGAVALLVGMFLIYNTVSITVVERRREIGTLRALGVRRGAVLLLFATEAAVVGSIGGLGGVGMGILLSRQLLARVSESISALYLRVNANEVHAPALVWVLGALLGAAAAVIAGLVPASGAARVNPVESLRRGTATRTPRPSLPYALGAAGAAVMGLAVLCVQAPALVPTKGGAPIGGYVAAFLVLIGSALVVPFALRVMDVPMRALGALAFGAPGRLAADNLARAPLRTSVTVAALMTGVAMTVNVASFVESFRGSIEGWIASNVPADLFVNSSSSFIGVQNNPLEPGLREEIARIPGVDEVDPVRLVRVSFRGRTAFLLSLQKAVYLRHARPQYIEAPDGPEGAADVSLSENLARKWGLHRGDTISLRTPAGVRRYRVGSVVVDYTSDAGTMLVDRSLFIRDFGDDLVDSFDVYLTAGGRRRVDQVRREILRRFGRRYDLRVRTNLELREQIMSFVNQMFQIMRAMELVALLIAVLGVANSLIASVLDRTRELGILRAIGASRGQVLRSVLAEAGLIGLLSSLLGAPAGAMLGYLSVRVINTAVSGWSVPFSFAWGAAAQTTVLVTLAALAAGIWPSRSATRVQPVVALRAE